MLEAICSMARTARARYDTVQVRGITAAAKYALNVSIVPTRARLAAGIQRAAWEPQMDAVGKSYPTLASPSTSL